MDKKQLYIVMIVSVLFLLGIIGYRWLFPEKEGKDKKKAKTPVTKPATDNKAAGKTVVKGKRPAPKKGKGVKGATIGAVKAISKADLSVEGVTDLKTLRTRFGLALDRSRPDAAKKLLDRAVSMAAKDAELVEFARPGCQQGFAKSAKRAVARLIAAAPIKAFYQSYLNGLCALTAKQPTQAAAHLRKALMLAKSDVQRALVLTQQCRIAVDAKQVGGARVPCKGALDKSGDHRAMFHAARLELLGNDKSPKAVTLLDRSLRLDRQQTDAASVLAAVQLRLGLKVKAVQTLAATGAALAKAGRHNTALAQFEKMVKIAPKDAKAHLGVARALRALGKDDPAVKRYRQAGELAKGNVILRVELAGLLQKKSVLDAVKVLEDAQQIDPASKPVAEALAAVRARLASKQPKRQRQHLTVVEGKLLKLRFTSWGGTPSDVILKGKKYREIDKGVIKKGSKGKKGKLQQVNLVRTSHPYWYPMRLDFDGSSFRVPPFPRRHPRQAWEYQSWERLRWDGKKFVVHRAAKGHVVKRRGKHVFGYRWPAIYPGMAPPAVVIDRIYQVDPDKSYAWDMEIRVVNRSAKKQTVKMKIIVPSVDAEKENRSFFNPVSLKKEAVCMVGDKVFMRTLSSIRGTDKGCMGCDASSCACRRTPAKGKTFTGKVRWIGIDEMYFLFAVAMNEKKDVVCRLSDDDHASAKGAFKVKPILMSAVIFPDENLPHKGSVATWQFKVFSGPKNSEELSKVRLGGAAPKLEESIDYGLFWFIGQPMIWMMKQIQKVVGNWGIAIILLTILIKLLTAPLTMKQMRSMKGMADLKPEIDKLKEECGEDKQRFQQEMWALYKSHKINPLSGCLPMVLQMPIYIAWYQALMVSVDLYRAPLFGWIHDLTKPDIAFHIAGYGIPILPILMGATMFLQQRMTPTTADNPQAKMMMYMMPAMFTFFMLFLPSGLTLYILTNTVLTMIHQWYMNHSD